jgi:hypothetical protein
MKDLILKSQKLFFLIVIPLSLLTLISACNSTETKTCKGLLCEFYDEIKTVFESTGVEKDQGYMFLSKHSELDSTTNRIIIRSTEGIYFAYPSKEGWYAQKKDDDKKFNLNELGHFLAEKEINNTSEIQKLFDKTLKDLKVQLLTSFYSNDFPIQNKIVEHIQFDSTFMVDDLAQLKKGEITMGDFMDSMEQKRHTLFYDSNFSNVIEKSAKKGEYPKIGVYGTASQFYPITNRYYTILWYEKLEWDYLRGEKKLIESKKLNTKLYTKSGDYYSINYDCSFFIYVPQEKKWYGIDKFEEINKKYKILKELL